MFVIDFEKRYMQILLYIITFLFFVKYVTELYRETYFSIDLKMYYRREKNVYACDRFREKVHKTLFNVNGRD